MSGGLLFRLAIDAASAILVLTLVAMGLFIIFGLMKVINMAHGEFYMLGAYVAWWTTQRGVSFWLGLISGAVLVAGLGITVERIVIRPLYARGDLSTLLATWGISLALQRGVVLVLGAHPELVAAPVQGSVVFLGFSYPYYQLIQMVIAALAIVGVLLIFYRTSIGLRARATIENPEMAEALGVDTSRMYMLSFGLGAGLAGFAGALAAPFVSVVPTMGLDYVVRSFLVVITGGSASILGALFGGTIVGGWESAFTSLFNATYAQITVLLIVILVVLVRPRGIFSR